MLLEMLGFAALIVGKKDKPMLVKILKQDGALAWSSIRSNGGQAHGVRFQNLVMITGSLKPLFKKH